MALDWEGGRKCEDKIKENLFTKFFDLKKKVHNLYLLFVSHPETYVLHNTYIIILIYSSINTSGGRCAVRFQCVAKLAAFLATMISFPA